MSLDFGKAFKAPASFNDWVMKVIIGGILLCIPIANLIVFGYLAKYVKNLLNGDSSLPDYSNTVSLFVTGAKLFVAMIIFFVPAMIIMFIVSLVFAKAQFVSMLVNPLINFIWGFAAMFMVASFAVDEKIMSIIDFRRAKLLFAGNPSTVSAILYMIALNIIYFIFAVVCSITIVGVLFIPFLIYAMAVSLYNIVGQFAHNSPKFDEFKSVQV